MLQQGEWTISLSNLQKGCSYNIYAVDISYDGVFDHDHQFQGKIDIPSGQLQRCCIEAQGKNHQCDFEIVKVHSQKVILRIPETSMTDDQCKMVGTIGVASAIFDGVVFHGYNEKALSGFDDISPISGEAVWSEEWREECLHVLGEEWNFNCLCKAVHDEHSGFNC